MTKQTEMMTMDLFWFVSSFNGDYFSLTILMGLLPFLLYPLHRVKTYGERKMVAHVYHKTASIPVCFVMHKICLIFVIKLNNLI